MVEKEYPKTLRNIGQTVLGFPNGRNQEHHRHHCDAK